MPYTLAPFIHYFSVWLLCLTWFHFLPREKIEELHCLFRWYYYSHDKLHLHHVSNASNEAVSLIMWGIWSDMYTLKVGLFPLRDVNTSALSTYKPIYTHIATFITKKWVLFNKPATTSYWNYIGVDAIWY